MIFKYLSFERYGRQNLERALVHNELRWTSFCRLNDPFDGNPDKTNIFRAINPNLGTAERLEQFDVSYKEALGRISVFCASHRSDCPLMWSHYASEHRGVCLHLQETSGSDFYGVDVIYSDERPFIVGLTEDLLDQLERALRTKSTVWQYECERRVVRVDPEGHYPVPKGTITGMYLGCNINCEDREFVVSIAANHRPDLKIWQCDLSKTHYRLNFREIRPVGGK